MEGLIIKINHICFIVPNYPTKTDPMYTFVRELTVAISQLGIKCSVVAPQSITNFIFKKSRKRPFYWKDKTKENNVIDVYQPIHFPFLNIGFKGRNLAGYLTSFAVKYAFKKNKLKPDVLYAHFWHSGVIAAELALKSKIPVFVATGESKIWVESLYSRKRIDKAKKSIKGVISVSVKNLKESIGLDLCKKEKAIVLPNAINPNQFYKIDKQQARKKLNIDNESFIIAFTGSFSHRKGALRVAKAIENLHGVKAIFIGSGEQKIQGNNILIAKRLPHNEIVNYLNTADVFVLPTLAEGSSNAIIEAMACGLPIISSNLPFNDELLNEENSIRIDPNSIEEIRKAIVLLRDNKDKRTKMAKASLNRAKDLEIKARARRIVKFIDEHVKF